MPNIVLREFKYGQHSVIIETGTIARQATAAVTVNMDGTVVLVTVVNQKQITLEEYTLPLTVNYQARTYAAGRIPGSFFRREGRPSEIEVIVARLIDRSIRPVFSKGFLDKVQVTAMVISVNPQINPDVVAIIGASAALSISGIPFNGPIGVARVGYINSNFVLNPTVEELAFSKLDLIIAGTKKAILMVESESKILSEDQILDAIYYGHKQQQIVIDNIQSLSNEVSASRLEVKLDYSNNILDSKILNLARSLLSDAYQITGKKDRYKQLNIIRNKISLILQSNGLVFEEKKLNEVLQSIESKIVRGRLLSGELRIDGRSNDEIRSIDAKISVFPRTHGSALFTRGDTQALVIVTLGTSRDAQNLDEIMGERTDSFLFHYNFPPYSVGEIGMLGSPKRREIGHGRLAKRGMLAVIPKQESFPYTIRVVSEITESNGSSSMASICGASLALMDAGVPIRTAVAGIAMGLIKEEDKLIILSDIISDEDRLGDMDLKVAGSNQGITALQMDIKISEGITREIIQTALDKARYARLHILHIMEQTISTPRTSISKFAPKIHIMHIDSEKIKDLIGKNGVTIRAITEESNTSIEVENDGTVKIVANDSSKINLAISRIEEITTEIRIGCIYKGKITRIVGFGIFVIINNSREGLVHISQISKRRINEITNYFKIGQELLVKVIDIDQQNRIRLTIK